MPHQMPKTGLAGLQENWRVDLTAAFSVAMVALPLSLGIAQASGLEPIAGLFSAIIGGLVTTFIRGTHIAINGPAKGIITVILAGTVALNDGSGHALNYVMAAIICAGALQVLLGVFKLGTLGNSIPSSVVQGLLAAIGIIIIITQLDDTFGFSYNEGTKSMLESVKELPQKFFEINPLAACIALGSLFILIMYTKVDLRLVKLLPAPMWVLLFGVPMVYVFGYHNDRVWHLFGREYSIEDHFLIHLPGTIREGLLFPNFSRAGDLQFWIVVISIFTISTIENLVGDRAVEKLDPFKRSSRLNKDMVGVGLSTMMAGAVGGLPIVTMIVTSSVNISNHARTKWSNFFQGAMLLLCILALTPLLQMIPHAALGAILIYTGYKLAAPQVFKHAWQTGPEQLFFVVATMAITLYTNLLWGIFGGMLITFMVQYFKSNLPIKTFLQYQRKVQMKMEERSDHMVFKVKGIVNFLNLNGFTKQLVKSIGPQGSAQVDFSNTRLVDLTCLEFLQEFGRKHRRNGGTLQVIGLDRHEATSFHPAAMRVQPAIRRKSLNERQAELSMISQNNNWSYFPGIEWDTRSMQRFQFFESRPIEYHENIITGYYEDTGIEWEISDLTFDEGALVAMDVYHITVEVIKLPEPIPVFDLNGEAMVDRLLERLSRFTGQVPINFDDDKEFTRKFLLHGDDEEAIKAFFSPELRRFLITSRIYHIESDGKWLLIFRRMRLARPAEIMTMALFCRKLTGLIVDRVLAPVEEQ